MWLDWMDLSFQPLLSLSIPDHTFRSIWVRIFPLVSLPLGDPYANTEDYDHFSLTNAGFVQVYDLASEQLVARGKKVELDFAAATVKVDGRVYSLQPLWIVP